MLKKWEKIVLLQDWQNSGGKDLDVHGRIRVVAHFSSGIAELARVKITPREKGVSLFSRGGDFHARSLYYPWGQMGDYLESMFMGTD